MFPLKPYIYLLPVVFFRHYQACKLLIILLKLIKCISAKNQNIRK